MLNARTLFRRFILNSTNRKRSKRQPTQPAAEHLETRALLSTVSLDAGTLQFEADTGEADDVTVSSPDANTLRIEVGNGDAISLGSGTATGFSLSNSDSVLTVTLDDVSSTIESVQIDTADLADMVHIQSLPESVTAGVTAGDGNDYVNASTASESIAVFGGFGNDTLIGGQADDQLHGESGRDSLLGGPGADTLDGGNGSDHLNGAGVINVNVENLQETDGGLLTPFFLATGNGNYDFFDVGSAASPNLERLAEDGTTGPRIDAALASGGVNEAIATSNGPIGPGETRDAVLIADATNTNTQFFSFASMFIPSNDAFIGNDNPSAYDLFDDDGNFIERTGATSIVITGDDVYDAGTEVNDEIPENTAALNQSSPNTGVTENGVITQHPGFQGSERLGGTVGNILTARPNADFTVADTDVAQIQLTTDDGADVLLGGRGADTLDGGAGNDSLLGGFGRDVLNGGSGDDYINGNGQIRVTVTNLQETDGGLLTPFFLATGNGNYDFFNVGSAASPNLERLAEDGTTGPRIDAAIASGGVGEAIATDNGPIAPGESRVVFLTATPGNDLTQYLSFASMFIPSNDAFIGNDDPRAIDLFDDTGNVITRRGSGAFVVTGNSVYDAGTEVNDEIPENTAALAQSSPNTGVTENGVITQHPGFQGSDRLGGTVGNILTARPNADFTLADALVASIQVDQGLDSDDVITGGDGNDTLDGARGNDTLIGGDGDDMLHGAGGRDAVFGNDGEDTIDGGAGPDTLDGGSADDEVIGGSGNDVIFGGSGSDTLDGGIGADEVNGGGAVTVTVTNLQEADGGLLTPFFLATGNGNYDFFNVGSAASASLERLAEDGTTGPRIDAAIASGGVGEAVATSGGPIAPGESRSVEFSASSFNDLTQYLSFASMFIPSNDAFIGNDDPRAIDLFDDTGDLITREGSSAIVITGDDVYDAGTEVNDEIPENTAALAQSAPNTGVTEDGVIRQHPGFQGSDRLGGSVGNILTARPNGDFTAADAQVARIEIVEDDGDDLIFGGDGADKLTGGAGNDSLIGGSGRDMLAGGAGNDFINGGGQITVTVTNLQEENGGLLTPAVLTTTNGVYDIFDVGSAASPNLERLAEDGTTGPRIAAALASGGVNEAIATSGGPIAPGESRSVVLNANSFNDLTQYLSFTSMFIPSNDAFIGNDDPQAIDLFDDNGALISRVGDSAIIVTGDDVYDAGTEVNDEIPENTAALAQSSPDTGETEDGVISQHPGFQGSVRLGGPIGNILTARPNADFTVADALIARIEIEEIGDTGDVIYGGAGDDTIQGGAGNDVTFISSDDGNDV
ncbi:MAG: spondin domain-containing protein, partial [Planctomycetaceae bacterium]